MLLPQLIGKSDRANRKWRTALERFVEDRDGGVTLFSLFIFVIMLIVAGMAVDLMRYETRRTALQNTVDAAVLAGANLKQKADCETLIRDFVEKSGYDRDTVVPTCTEERVGNTADGELVSRTASAVYKLDMNTYFMNLIGIPELHGGARGGAAESVQGVEISLVVDISGSMGGSRIADLKKSAKNFFGIVLNTPNGQASRTSISVVPYNANVVVPDYLLARLNTQAEIPVTGVENWYHDTAEFDGAVTKYDREAPNSKCVQFYDSQLKTDDLTATDLDPATTSPMQNYAMLRRITSTTLLQMLSDFDEGDKSAGPGGNHDRPANSWNRFCDPNRSPIAVHLTNKDDLEDVIDGLNTGGWTSVDNGMKWGVALLDPGMRPIINDLVDADILDEDVRNRPADYDTANAIKVVVLMTDGENTIQRDLRNQYKRGPSPVWFSPSEAGASFGENDDDNPNYWDGFYVQRGRNNETSDYWYQGQVPWDRDDGAYHDRDELPGDAVQLTYTQLYERFSEYALANLFRDQSDNDDDRLDDMRSDHRGAVYNVNNNGSLNKRLTGNGDLPSKSEWGICDAAKYDDDIIVFTVAFQAPSDAKTQMQRCASQGGYYYDASNGAELDEAFRSIAGQITKLRLTQ